MTLALYVIASHQELHTVLIVERTPRVTLAYASPAHLETATGRVVLETDITSMLVVLLSQRNRAGEESRPHLVGTGWSAYQCWGISAAAAAAAAVALGPGSSSDDAESPLVAPART